MSEAQGPGFASPAQATDHASHEPTADVPAPAADDESPQPRRGRRIFRAVAWTLAGAGVAALAGLSGYLWLTHEQWTDQNDALRAEALELGEKLAQTRVEAEEASASLATTSEQLSEAKSTISTLADQDANATDDQRYAEEIAEWALDCANERDILVDYLKESWRYTDASLRAAESDINAYCADAAEAWDDYQAENE